MSTTGGVIAVLLVSLATVAIGTWGLRFSRSASELFVASRSVRPALNASAIGGEYLSAASFLGVAGLVLAYGAEMLWYPIGWTAGYLVLLVLVAAQLRRSGAYTLPDFAEARLESRRVRTVTSALVVAIGFLYLIPQFQGAGLTLTLATGLDSRLGGLVVAVVVLVNVLFAGMRSVTFVQAFQYWLKLSALAIPAIFLLVVWFGDGAPTAASAAYDPVGATAAQAGGWADPLAGGAHPLYVTYSLIVATFLGTMGLPHVAVRFYTNPDGRAARRTTLVVLGLLGLFYLLPPVYAALGRIYAVDLVTSGHSDTVVLELPGRMIGGAGGDLLGALIVAGAFAAFLSTSSGLTVAIAGVVSQDLMRRWLPDTAAFRAAAVAAVVLPYLVAVVAAGVPVATTVGLAFAVAASTFCPLLVLGIWWPRLTGVGAVAGLLVGGVTSGACVVHTFVARTILEGGRSDWVSELLAQPAAWTVPLAFATMIGVSLATAGRRPAHVTTFMVRLHTPETLRVDRG